MRAAVFLIGVFLVIFVTIYICKPDLLFAQVGPEQDRPKDQELPEKNSKPNSKPPVLDEDPQLDAPEPEPEPEPDPAPSKDDPFEHVDGSNLLVLVSKQTTIGRYAPADLELIPGEIIHPDQRKWQYYLRREPLKHLRQMWAAAAAEGVSLTVTSAYRSYETQNSLFASYVARDGLEKAQTYSARAGQSEHQLGTTVDFNTDIAAGAEGHGWLAENAHDFGFAMSYPQGQEHITGYIYEPWHYRYIGAEAAKEWKESGLPLCLYLEQRQ